ncbi:cation transporter [Herbiconiux sp.]|uniref:heavy-metal-associated domain-containing protein n=1 Tax=Herbiconiux sp. TaxID=1871186 RepID=UPI0025BB3A00|nr:cation transporter [Herbiconiux sp.]
MTEPIRPDLGLVARDGSACGCASHAEPAGTAAQVQPAPPGRIPLGRTPAEGPAVDYLVTGMTCEHCVASVTEEVSAIDGVDGVTVRLNVGGESLVSVRGAAAANRAAVSAAIDEAGYALAGE